MERLDHVAQRFPQPIGGINKPAPQLVQPPCLLPSSALLRSTIFAAAPPPTATLSYSSPLVIVHHRLLRHRGDIVKPGGRGGEWGDEGYNRIPTEHRDHRPPRLMRGSRRRRPRRAPLGASCRRFVITCYVMWLHWIQEKRLSLRNVSQALLLWS